MTGLASEIPRCAGDDSWRGTTVRAKSFEIAALVLILALAAYLRFNGIARESLWADEGLTVRILRLPIAEMIPRIRDWEQTPPLYYIVMRVWVSVFGDTEGWLRAPSVIFGVAAVGAMYVWVKRMFSRGAGLSAAVLLAVSSYQIAFAQEARTYSLFVLLTILSCDAFIQLMQARTERREVMYIVTSALLLYAHLYGIFVIAAQNIAYLVMMLARRERGIDLKRWIGINLAVAVLYSPWLPTVWMWVKGVRAWFWVKPMTLDEISRAYELYAGSRGMLVVLVALAVVSAVAMRKRAPASVTMCVAVMVLPVVVPVVLSVIGRPTFVARYAIISALGLLALASVSANVAHSAAIFGLVVLSLSAPPVVEPKPQWREAGKYLEANMAPGDFAAVHRKGATCMYDYYVNRPDVRRIGSDGSAVPVTQPLPEGKRIWLVLYTEVHQPRRFLERGYWKVHRQKMFREVLVMELEDDMERLPKEAGDAGVAPAEKR
jgi:mannosyltransferase